MEQGRDMLVKEIKEKYPLHFAVWNSDHKELEEVLKENKVRARII